MPIQTSYPFLHTVGEEGLLYGTGPRRIITVYATENLYPGRVVCYPSSYSEDEFGRPRVEMATATGSTVVGVVARGRNEELSGDYDFLTVVDTTQEMYYRAGVAVPVLVQGSIYVQTEEAVNPTSNVFFRFDPATAPNDVRGRFRTDADTDNADQISAGMKFMRQTTAAGLVPLEINLP